jgi:hypothetical protein
MVKLSINHINLDIQELKESIEKVISGNLYHDIGFKGDPFVISPDDTLGSFVNRENEMKQLFLSLVNLSQKYIPHIAILGWHGIGKTHFLKVAKILVEDVKSKLNYNQTYYINGIEEFKREFVGSNSTVLNENSRIIASVKQNKKVLAFIDDLDVVFDRYPSIASELFSILEGGIIGTWDAHAWDAAKRGGIGKVPKTESVLLKSLSEEHSKEILLRRLKKVANDKSIDNIFPSYVISKLAAISEGNPYRLITYGKRYMNFIIQGGYTIITEEVFKKFCAEIDVAFIEDIKKEIDSLTQRQKEILNIIVERIEVSTEDLASMLGVTRIAAFKYLKFFKGKDILESKQKNRTIYYYIPTEMVEEISDYLEKLRGENENTNAA